MKVYKGIAEIASPPKKCVLTIGNFDGVHIGHQVLLGRIVEHAKRISGTPVVYTFRPHPHFVLRPTEAPLLLNTYEEKLELLAHFGVTFIVEEPFSREFSNIGHEAFVEEILVKKLGAKVIYLGYDFAFGKGRSGSAQTLQQLARARGIELDIVPPLLVDGSPVSSSRIRQALDKGDISLVNRCLGRAFFLRGLVWRGDGRGRKIGVPTANLQSEMRKFPRTGVYASRTHWRDKVYDSVTNIGFNPTFKGDGNELPLKIETHLFGMDADMYGDEIQVDFHAFLREEKKFSGVEALLAQIREDCTKAKEILAAL